MVICLHCLFSNFTKNSHQMIGELYHTLSVSERDGHWKGIATRLQDLRIVVVAATDHLHAFSKYHPMF